MRVSIAFAALGVLLMGLLGRVFALSVIEHGEYQALSERNSTTVIPILAERGRIFSRDGEVLAQTVFSGTALYINARQVRDDERAALARELAGILSIDAGQLLAKLERHRENAGLPLAWFLDESQMRALHDLMEGGRAPGLHFRERKERRYPKGAIAAQIIGFANMEGAGGGGVELAYDSYLRGKDGSHNVRVDARRRAIPSGDDKYIPPGNGLDLHLTIDSTVQRFAEAALDDLVENWAPESCCAVVMESATGRILAVANRPTFDPNAYFDATDEERKNRSITDGFEPGSVFKPLILAGGMEMGLFEPQTRIPYKSIVNVRGRNIIDDHPIPGELRDGAGTVAVADGIAKSSNTMANFVAQCVLAGHRFTDNRFDAALVQPFEGAGRLDALLHGFGFGQYTGLDIGGARWGESRGRIPSADQWTNVPNAVRNVTPSIAQGYQVQVTALQMLNCFNAIAIDGVRVRPYVVEKVAARDGRVEMERQPEVMGTSGFSAATAAKMRDMLKRVATGEGTARRAKLDDYTVAGKTGTSKIAGSGGYLENAYTCSFVGFAPADKPVLSVIVVARHPSKRPVNQYGNKVEIYGGTVAAPAFARIVDASLKYLGVPPEREGDTTRR